jgi:hypothetical protein
MALKHRILEGALIGGGLCGVVAGFGSESYYLNQHKSAPVAVHNFESLEHHLQNDRFTASEVLNPDIQAEYQEIQEEYEAALNNEELMEEVKKARAYVSQSTVGLGCGLVSLIPILLGISLNQRRKDHVMRCLPDEYLFFDK